MRVRNTFRFSTAIMIMQIVMLFVNVIHTATIALIFTLQVGTIIRFMEVDIMIMAGRISHLIIGPRVPIQDGVLG